MKTFKKILGWFLIGIVAGAWLMKQFVAGFDFVGWHTLWITPIFIVVYLSVIVFIIIGLGHLIGDDEKEKNG